MARQNVPLLSFNRGLIGPKSLARVDLERTRLSAETCTNFTLATQGSMSLRPGTQYQGSSFHDTGAEFLEFIASADDLALIELTNDTGSGLGTMRSWQGSDAHDLSLLGRPAVDTTVALTDTGWVDASTGGDISTNSPDEIPQMSDSGTDGVTIAASSEEAGSPAWQAGDNKIDTNWSSGMGTAPQWWKVDFGSGNEKAITSYSIRAPSPALGEQDPPTAWTLQGNDVDTGTGWVTEDSRTSQSFSVGQKRTYTAQNDTGQTAYRYWRLNITAPELMAMAEVELFGPAPASGQAVFGAQGVTLNATAIGSVAKVTRRVIVSDTGTEHSLDIEVERGPVTLRVGSTDGDDDYITETSLGTGYHNLAFTPQGNFHITLQNSDIVNRIVRSLSIGDSGTVELRTPWTAGSLDNIRYDQSADVIYVDCKDVRPQKIERRGTGRSWSVVDYAPDDGPFLTSPSSSAKLSASHFYGNSTLSADTPLFRTSHVGSLIRVFNEGQGGEWPLGALDARTDAIEVTGIGDTGAAGPSNERRITFDIGGTYTGRIRIERSFDGPDFGFKPITSNIGHTLDTGDTAGSDTGTFTVNLDDTEDNISVHYRARMIEWTSGAALVTAIYRGGGVTGRARITGYNSNTDVDIEVLSRFSDTGMTDNWQFGHWSTARGFPTAVRLHGGRLAHAQGGSIFLSASDDFENFDVSVEGDAAPIIRTIGSGPVDNIHYLMSALRLLVGTAGSELTVKSSAIDEPLTPSNSSIVPFSTNGSANVRAVAIDTRAIMVQRSKQRVFELGPAQNTLADYEAFELTLLVPDLLAAGVVSIAVQRQPDTRIHCVLGDGRVAILTFEPSEEVIAWSIWEGDTGTSPLVERAMVLPGIEEDAVYYHIRRTINGAHKRYLEKWALESECLGDTGLSWLADCAVSFSADTGRALTFADAAEHLGGEQVVVWGDLDSGSTPYIDASPDVSGVQVTHTVDTGGDLTITGLTDGLKQGVAGLGYRSTWKSSKLAYAAELGSALGQMKRVPQVSLILYKTHQHSLSYGARDTGNLDKLPSVIDGKVIDADTIHQALDNIAVPVPSTYQTDPRLIIRAKAPRPATILAAVPTVVTSEK
jgi:hypothetical protein